MKILMVISNFIPEIGSSGHIYLDLAKGFISHGHEVDVITSYPRLFNLPKAERDLDVPWEEDIDGIKVHRCKGLSIRDSKIARGSEHFVLPLVYFNKYKELGKRFDVCLFHIPPVPLYYMARWISHRDNTKTILNIQDFHPQELVDGGYTNNFVVIKLLKYIEKQAYSKADFVSVLSEGGIDYVIKRGAKPSRVKCVFNGISDSDLTGYRKQCDFKVKEGIEDKFLISYAGILSPFQCVDNLLDAAGSLQDEKDIIFYIVGDGMKKEHLQNRIEKESLQNTKLLSFQPRKEYFNIVNSSDIEIVTLDRRMKAPCIPGKLCNLLAIGKPVIAIVADDSETARVIKKSGGGLVIEPGQIDKLKEIIIALKNNPDERKRIAANGRRFFLENMEMEKCLSRYEEIFRLVSCKN